MRFPIFGAPEPQKARALRGHAYSAIVDATSYNLLALTPFIAAAQVVHEGTPNSVHATDVTRPNYTHGLPFDPYDVPSYVEWTWDYKSRTFVRMPAEKIRAELRERSLLAMAKIPIVRRMTANLNAIRHHAHTGVHFQETVYMTKKMQAQEFKKAGYPEDAIIDYPYVLQYADYAGISLKQAADDIIFKSKLEDEKLAQSELLRMKHFNKLKEATRIDQLPDILQHFLKDAFHI